MWRMRLLIVIVDTEKGSYNMISSAWNIWTILEDSGYEFPQFLRVYFYNICSSSIWHQ
jgi:hypothetical protein